MASVTVNVYLSAPGRLSQRICMADLYGRGCTGERHTKSKLASSPTHFPTVSFLEWSNLIRYIPRSFVELCRACLEFCHNDWKTNEMSKFDEFLCFMTGGLSAILA